MDIRFRSDEPLYLQIAEHIRRQVALGRLRPGERLPAIRELAQKLGLNPGTVARGYHELEREGIVAGRRGGGSLISGGAGKGPLTEQRRRRLGLVVERAVLEALGLGFAVEDIETAFALRLAEWRERRRAQGARKKPLAASRRASEVLFLGSHDLAVEVLASHLHSVHRDVRLKVTFVGSLAGLMAVGCGEADITGAHLMDSESGEFNVPFVRRLIPNEAVVLMNLVRRSQGLTLARGNPKRVLGIRDLVRPDVTFVNRQKGSGTRILLDSQLLKLGITPSEIKGYDHEERTHIAVASLVAQGSADVGLGIQSAATVAGLDFIPLLEERYDLVALLSEFKRLPLQRIHEVVRSKDFQKMVRSIPGYDVSDTGKVTTVGP